MDKRIGIIGSGMVGKTLAAGFAAEGHEVRIGSRSPEKLAEWQAAEGKGVQSGSFDEVAAFAEVVILAVQGQVAEEALRLAGAENLAGKVVLDACNPIAAAGPDEGVLRFFTGQNESLMEGLQQAFPQARFVKCFSCVGAHLMLHPKLEGGLRPAMFICGNDDEAKAWTKEMLDRIGWNTEDMGGAKAARAIEPLCMLWCIPGFRDNQWNHAFALLRTN